MNAIARPLFAFCLALAMAIPLVLAAQDAYAHASTCTGSQHASDRGTGANTSCRAPHLTELAEWCHDNGNRTYALFRNASFQTLGTGCRFDNQQVCESAGYRFTQARVNNENVNVCVNNGNRSRCAHINAAGTASYNFSATPHACQCNTGHTGNAEAGECVSTTCNPGEIFKDGSCQECDPGDFVRRDGTCGKCDTGEGPDSNGECVECAVGTGVINGRCGQCTEQLPLRPDKVCGQCDSGQAPLNRQCVAVIEKCTGEGWFNNDGESCDRAGSVYLAGGVEDDYAETHRCRYDAIPRSSIDAPTCGEVFGPNYAIPSFSGNAVFVYNCDPDGSKGLIPATVNTIAARECQCAGADNNGVNLVHVPGEQLGVFNGIPINRPGSCQCPNNQVLVNGACSDSCPNATDVILNGECVTPQEKCQMSPGWRLSGNSCFGEAPTEDIIDASDGSVSGGCFLTGSTNPCASIFGANLDFPSTGAVNYVFNCDPDGTRGLIPARANLTGATECECADSDNTHMGLRGLDPDEGIAYEAGYCYPEFPRNRAFAYEEASDADWCGYFGGNADTAGGRICSGVDAADTFCVLDGPDLDCRGLLNHVRRCNEDLNRLALNPFLCGQRCGSGEARGGACE